jgi:hypothetical protein
MPPVNRTEIQFPSGFQPYRPTGDLTYSILRHPQLPGAAQMNYPEHKPLLVPSPVARQIIGVGNTKYWELVKAGKIKLVEVGGRKMATYASLEALAQTPAA